MKTILLEHTRSLNNIGAIFRSADGAGFDRVICTGYTATPPRAQISKTALWAENSIIWEYYETPLDAIKKYKDLGYKIYAVEKNDTSIDFRTIWTNDEDILLIMGNEVEGVSPTLLEQSDNVLHIPMRGIKWSLNVSVAASIIMYHFCS